MSLLYLFLYSFNVIHLLLGLLDGANKGLATFSLAFPDTCGKGPGSGASSAAVQLDEEGTCAYVDSSVCISSIRFVYKPPILNASS